MSKSAPVPIAEELAAHAGFVRRLARRLVFDEDRADELAQQAFVAALTSRTQPRKGLRPWLFGVARNLNRMRFRAERRRAEVEGSRPLPPHPPGPEELASSLELQAILAAEVRRLPKKYREAVYLRFYQGLNSEEIGARRGIPSATVRTRLRRGLAILRDRLDQRNGGDRRAWVLLLMPLVLGPAASAAAAAGTAASTATIAGGVATLGKKLAVVAAVLVLMTLAGGLYFASFRVPGGAPLRTGGKEGSDRDYPDEPGFEDRAALPVEDPDALPAPVDLDAADRRYDLCGRVVDPEGRPVPGARVETLPPPFRELGGRNFKAAFFVEPDRRSRSAEDGTFKFRLGGAELVYLRVSAEGFGEVILPRCQAGERVELVLGRGADLEVVTRDEAGAAVDGAVLWLYRGSTSRKPPILSRGVTGSDGRWKFPGLTEGETLLFVEHPTLGTVGWRSPTIPGSGKVTCEVVLPTGRPVAGRVLDAVTGAPVPGAVVGEGPIYFRPVRTGRDGRFTFRAWSGQMERLYCSAPGYGFQWCEVGEDERIELRLSPGGEVRGRVLADGFPLSGARVTVSAAPLPVHHVCRAKTDADGTFTVSDLRSDLPLAIKVEHPGFGTLRRELPGGGASTLRENLGGLRLAAAERIAGVVRDPAGRPVTDASVALVVLDAGPAAEDWKVFRRTDDLGRFLFPDLSAGRYRVMVSREGTPSAHRAVHLAPGPAEPPLRIVFGGGGRLRVIVTDRSGSPISGAFVACRSATAWTRGDGEARLAGLTEEEVTLTVTADRRPGRRPWLPKTVGPLIPEDQEITVVLNPAAQVRGTVVDGSDRPLAGLRVRAFEAGGEAQLASEITGREGEFLLLVPQDGGVDLTADGRPSPEEAHFIGEANGVVPSAPAVTIRARRTPLVRTVSVRVLDPEGAAIEGVKVVVSRRPGLAIASLRTDVSGRATFQGLPAERLLLSVTRGAANSSRALCNPGVATVLPAGQEVVVSFAAGARIAGRVVGGDGSPLIGAVVELSLEAGGDRLTNRLERALTDEEGKFEVTGRPGARHRLAGRWKDPDGRWHAGTIRNLLPNDLEVVLPIDLSR